LILPWGWGQFGCRGWGQAFVIALSRLSGGKVSSLYGIEYISYQSVETPFPGCRLIRCKYCNASL